MIDRLSRGFLGRNRITYKLCITTQPFLLGPRHHGVILLLAVYISISSSIQNWHLYRFKYADPIRDPVNSIFPSGTTNFRQATLCVNVNETRLQQPSGNMDMGGFD